jgi:L-fucose isomerase-like protein
MSFNYISVASAMHKQEELSALQGNYERALNQIGGHRIDGTVADGETLAFTFVLTGGVENGVIRRYRSRVQQGRTGPLLLIAHTGHSALAASLEILAQVHQEGGTGRIYLLRGAKDTAMLAEIERTANCLAANRRLSKDRLGLIGAPSDWLVASSQRPEVVTSRFGMRVLPLSVEDLRKEIARDPAPTEGPEFEVWDRATSAEGVQREGFAHAVGVSRGLKALVKANQLTAVTVRCFDLVSQDGTTGCLALSQLADEGITAGCEGDIPSVVMLRWLWHLTGKAGWMANPSDLDVKKGELLLAHCTVPLGLVEEHRLTTHFESDLGIGIDGTIKKGPVTLLRLGGADLDRWWGAEGTLYETSHAPGLCRTQIRVRIPVASAAELLKAPLGNHLIVIPGHVKALFREAFELSAAIRT